VTEAHLDDELPLSTRSPTPFKLQLDKRKLVPSPRTRAPHLGTPGGLSGLDIEVPNEREVALRPNLLCGGKAVDCVVATLTTAMHGRSDSADDSANGAAGN
jgi:hypothetical protein